MSDKSQREEDKQALVRVFTSDRAYCAGLMSELFLPKTEQARLMTERLLESMTFSTGMNERCMREANEQALVRVFTSDKQYCRSIFEKLFMPETVQAKAMTTRLLETIYASQMEDLYTQGLSKEDRIRHYMARIEWTTETCRLYAEGARQMAGYMPWEEWEQALGEEEDAKENGRPETVDEMLRELANIMHPDVQSRPWRGATVQERRINYREYMVSHPVRPYIESECLCVLLAYQVPLMCLTRFLAQAGSTRRSDGGSDRTRAGLILAHASWGSRDSRWGKARRAALRSWLGSRCALDLTDMRMARRSSVAAMACAVGVSGSCVAMKSLMILA